MRTICGTKCIHAKQLSLKMHESKQIQLKGEIDKPATLMKDFSALLSATFIIIT